MQDFDAFLQNIEANISSLSLEQVSDLNQCLRRIEVLDQLEKAKTDFLTFVRLCGPSTIVFSSWGIHHRMAEAFQRLVFGDLKRVAISMPPRYGKSLFSSVLLPAWYIGNFPDRKIMQISATQELATGFGRQVKTIIDSPIYQQIFPSIKLSKDSKASGKFAIHGHHGIYHALGITSNLAGIGGDLVMVDDATTEQEGRTGDPSAYDTVWELFNSGPRQRLQPGGRLGVVQTRWSKADLIGKLKRSQADDPNVDRYEYIEFPALDMETDESTFPEFWPTEEAKKTRSNLLKTQPHFWYGPYQQNPTSVVGCLIPPSTWKAWANYRKLPGETEHVEFVPPDCFITIMVLDTAETENKRSNPTACTIWGVFEYKEEKTGKKDNYLILLHSYCEKMEFHRLKRIVKQWVKDWKPDTIIVEAKSTGPALRSELAESHIFTTPVRPKPGEDKASRLASVSDVFHSGRVYYIPTAANQVTITQVGDYPSGDGDDLVDTVSYAVQHYRRGGLVKTNNDVEDVVEAFSVPDGGWY